MTELAPTYHCIIDVETTGKGINGNRITEFCAVRLKDGEIIDKFTSLVNPEQYIPPFITNLTGIDDAMVEDAPLFEEIAQRVLEITEGAIFVAHNVNFDYSFIREEFARLGSKWQAKRLCTVRLSRKLLPGLPSYSLGKIARHFVIVDEQELRRIFDELNSPIVLDGYKSSDYVYIIDKALKNYDLLINMRVFCCLHKN